MDQFDKAHQEFVALLRECTGQEADLVGESTLVRAVREGMALSKCKDTQEFLARLRANRSTLQRFVNAVTIGESWFFRDEAPFKFLRQYLSQRVQAQNFPIEMLSLPCASGEEAYSMAMTASEVGLTPANCRIEGVDINTACLRRGREAEYRGHAFRGLDPDRLALYFDKVDDRYQVKSAIREYVEFYQNSVVNPGTRLFQHRYDVIFFRNLLIYLGPETRRQALALMRRLLKPEGVLVVGHAETGLMAAAGFAPENMTLSLAFRCAPSLVHSGGAAAKSATSAATSAIRSTQPDAPRVSRGHTEQNHLGATLQEVEQLANAGHIAEAHRRCSWLLATTNDDPQVCYLCAIVAEAAGDGASAEALLRETLRTCPEHYRALVHLAASLATRGDHNEATELRRRAQQLADTDGHS